jgi:hypothetical protein
MAADDLQVSIQIQGVAPLIRKLGLAAAARTLTAPMMRSVARLQRRLATYPSPPPGSKYKRTGNLGRSWTSATARMTVSGGVLEGTIGNAARNPRGRAYGPFVQGEKTQAAIHRGRWITDEQALNLERPAIERDFKDAIDNAMH